MLAIHGSPRRLCDGVTRRDLLQIGGLAPLGLTLGDTLTGSTTRVQAAETSGSAKACILLFLFGSPPQHETFDPKPHAAAEVQGEMGAISTSVPGVQIGEGLPRIASMADRLTIVRSMTHPFPVHGVAYALSGMPTYTPAIESRPRDPQHWPFMGSVVDWLEARRNSGSPGDNTIDAAAVMPRNLGLPWKFGSQCTLPTLAGPYGAFLGSKHDPLWTDFTGTGAAVAPRLTDNQTQEVRDPFLQLASGGKFQLSPESRLPEDVHTRRLDARRLLLDQFDTSRRDLDRSRAVQSFSANQQRAFSLLTSSRVRDALDLDRETRQSRDAYGPTLFGQACLAARRLVEAGAKFVSVFWDPFGPFGGSVWDTHANHFPRLKQYLLPVFDQSYSALIGDLEQRGLLDSTVVLCTSEHGRTPKIDSKPKGGARHHWSRAYSSVFAGGGMAAGRVVGQTDAIAGDVVSTPVSPKDMQATTYSLLGYDPASRMPDRSGRPHFLAGDGIVRQELLG